MNPLLYDLELHQQVFQSDSHPDFATRRLRIERLLTMLNENEENLCKAIYADFGYREPTETKIADILSIRQEAKFILKNLSAWMKPIKVKTPLHLFPSKSYLMPQAKGVVGIMSPWNYPLNLALIPTLSAFAAGNRVWLKPSERSPRTSGYLATLVQQYFHPSELHVVNGGPQVAEHFASLPFAHLFFTGSTATGKLVAKAAAHHLTPTTLELGGKSPLIIDTSASLKDCAQRILYGKLFNAGQTCIAPDYVLVPESLQNPLIEALQTAYRQMYPNASGITHAIDDDQAFRWHSMISQAVQSGAQAVYLGGHTPTLAAPQATLILNVTSDMLVMTQEIFGPIMPIVTYHDTQEAIDFINSQPKPLAAYWFGNHPGRLKQFLDHTCAGGVTVNDTLLHFANHFLPFGGVGQSGMGAYHGKFGFDTFTHFKPVFEKKSAFGLTSLSGSGPLHPPYDHKTQRLIKVLEKFS